MKKSLFIAIAFLGISLSVSAPAGAEAPAPKDSVTLSAAQVADLILEEAYKHLGKPYRYGARGPKVFDCSGFTSYIYRQFGFRLSNSSRDQARDGRAVEGTLADLQKGDILIFGGRASRKSVGHVGIFIGMTEDGTDGTFVHAARGGVMIDKLSEEYYAPRFLGARRILPDFEPEVPEEPEPADANYGESFLPVRDTLALSPSDSRIVLFGDGTWAVLHEDGSLSAPDSDGRIILNPGGTWQPLQERISSVRIPSTAVPAPAATASSSTSAQSSPSASQKASTSSTTSQTASASSSASADDSSAEPEYYTIRSGDTLEKISKAHHTTIDRLCELNGITRKTILHIGHTLRVR